MAILSSMQSAALRLLGQKPGTFFGSQNTFEMEIADLINEVAIDVAKYQDWQALTRFATIAGDAVTIAFSLPDDYDRMLKNARIEDVASWFWGYSRIIDLSAFAQLRNSGFGPVPGAWALFDSEIQFVPAPTQASTYPYISANYARDAGTLETKPEFTSDTDTFLLPERLLTLGLVWRWRENKKLDASGDQEAFIKALDEYGASDKGARVYRSNARRRMPGVGVAWPWELG